MPFANTPEQDAIVAAATDTTDNLLVSALAGAAKTSTLQLIANALPGVNMLCVAFNKRIVDEMSEKMPRNCATKTLNAIGNAAWKDSIGKNCRVDFSKMGGIFKDIVATLSKDDQKEAWKSMGFVLKAVGHGKAVGYVPDACERKNKRLTNDRDFQESLEEIPTMLEWDLIKEVSLRSIELAFEGNMTFDDQLLMPTVFRAFFPSYALLLVDEAQDLSSLNHAMLRKMVKRRIIAVGDQCQAIYGFRGAHEEGMAAMAEQFAMTELPLSCSFRCPEPIVSHVQWRAPNMTSWYKNPRNPTSFVATPATWSLADLPDECAIICRNNAPLFAMAIDLLKFGRYPNLWGNDIAKGLIKTMKTLGDMDSFQNEAIENLNRYHEKKKTRARNKKALADTISCIRVFLDQCDTLGEAIVFAESVMASQGKIDLLTGHKSKGHEWNDVYFLDQQLIGKEGQEPNVRYVIATRSMERLTYVSSDTLTERDEPEEDY